MMAVWLCNLEADSNFFFLHLAIEVLEDTKPENTSQKLANGNKTEGEQDDNNNAGGKAVCFS